MQHSPMHCSKSLHSFKHLFYLYVLVPPCITCTKGKQAQGGQKTAPGPLKMELQVCLNFLIRVWEVDPGVLQEYRFFTSRQSLRCSLCISTEIAMLLAFPMTIYPGSWFNPSPFLLDLCWLHSSTSSFVFSCGLSPFLVALCLLCPGITCDCTLLLFKTVVSLPCHPLL